MADQSFGQYLLERRLGTGGASEVWLARATDGRHVVIKRPLPHLAPNPQHNEQLQAEARVVQQLSHANIARVLETGDIDGVAYVALEHLEGVDLGVLLKRVASARSRVPVPVALRMAHELAEALEYAHAIDGTVHRDVSAANVMVTLDGVTKLLDFDLRKNEPSDLKRAHLSPEQFANQPLDGRSDLYSLGLLLFEMLSGVRVVGPNAIPPLSTAWSAAPAELEAVVAKAVAQTPDERFATLREFSQALERCAPMADAAAVARWAASMSPNRSAVLPEAEGDAYVSSKSLDTEGALEAPKPVVTAADFDAPDEGSLELSRQVTAKSSVALPNSTGRPSMRLQPVDRLELPPENRVPKPPKPPEVLPTLAGKTVPPSQGIPARALVIAAGVVLVGVVIAAVVASREKAPIVLTPAPVAVVAAAAEVDAGDDELDPVTGMRKRLAPVKIGTPDHLAREHPDLEPVRYMIDSVPPGATITINGEVVGETPWGGDNDPLRGANITVVKKGFAKWSKTVEPGADFAETVKLKRGQ